MEVVLSWPTQLIEFINAYPVRSQSAPLLLLLLLLLPPISRLTQFGGGAAAFAVPSSLPSPAVEYALIARSRSADVYGKQCHQRDEYGVGLIRRHRPKEADMEILVDCVHTEAFRGASFSSYALVGYVACTLYNTLIRRFFLFTLCVHIFVEALSRNWLKCLQRELCVCVKKLLPLFTHFGLNKISESSKHFVPILVETIDPS